MWEIFEISIFFVSSLYFLSDLESNFMAYVPQTSLNAPMSIEVASSEIVDARSESFNLVLVGVGVKDVIFIRK